MAEIRRETQIEIQVVKKKGRKAKGEKGKEKEESFLRPMTPLVDPEKRWKMTSK